MLAVTGIRSRIVEELKSLLPGGEQIVRIAEYDVWQDDAGVIRARPATPPMCERYLLCAGLLRAQTLAEQSDEDVFESLTVNLIRPIRLCDEILAKNETARICVIGSESGDKWSYDGAYAAAKAALHKYVETKKLKPHQQLVCIAPSIIEDTAMTKARTDYEHLERRRLASPKQRFLRAVEIARFVHFLLYIDEGYTTGTVIRVQGGV